MIRIPKPLRTVAVHGKLWLCIVHLIGNCGIEGNSQDHNNIITELP